MAKKRKEPDKVQELLDRIEAASSVQDYHELKQEFESLWQKDIIEYCQDDIIRKDYWDAVRQYHNSIIRLMRLLEPHQTINRLKEEDRREN